MGRWYVKGKDLHRERKIYKQLSKAEKEKKITKSMHMKRREEKIDRKKGGRRCKL